MTFPPYSRRIRTMGLLAWSEDIEPSRATTAYVVASGVYFSLLTLSSVFRSSLNLSAIADLAMI